MEPCLRDSNTTIVSINRYAEFKSFMDRYNSNTTIVSINRRFLSLRNSVYLIQIQLLFLLIENKYRHITII